MLLGRIILAGIISLVAQSYCVAEDGQNQSTQPNFIILLADDLGYGDLSSYGHPSIETPALDRLAAEGQRWTDFYATASVCSPSRGALMTGKLPVRSGLYGVKNGVFQVDAKGGIPAKDRTVAEALRDAGYDTAMMGKWHLGDKADALPTRHGFDYWLGTPYSNDMDVSIKIREEVEAKKLTSEQGREKKLAMLIDPDRESSWWNTALINSRQSSSGYVDEIIDRPAKQEMLTRRYTQEAVSFITAHAKSDQPFFLYVAYNMPHVPTFASKSFEGKSLRGAYGDAVEEIDWSVNKIRRALEETGLAENTLLVFSSDNGATLPKLDGGSVGLLKGHKAQAFEGGMRVPGIFWWPGHIKPGVVHGIGTLTDIYATALSLAGINGVTDAVDSIDLSPVFEGKPSSRNTFAYYAYYGGWGGQLLGYRRGPWKVSFTEDGYAPSDKVMLYNLEHDPSERTDVSKTYPNIFKELVVEAKGFDAAIPYAEPIFDQ